MGINLKVLVRSFNCESRAYYVGNPHDIIIYIYIYYILYNIYIYI